MKLSTMGFEPAKIAKLDEMFPVQDLLFQTGQLVQYASGIFGYGTVPFRVMGKIEQIIRDVLDEIGCAEVSLPILQPESLWQESKRWDPYVRDGTMLVVKTEKGNFCVAPTAEEAIVNFAKKQIKSYKNLPATYYQIGPKFRNELRNRGYLLRGKNFNMMDAYSFDMTEKAMTETYVKMKSAYFEIFKRLGLAVIPVTADSGAIGGDNSEEFMFVHPAGEDTIYIDKKTGKGYNLEVLDKYKIDPKKCEEARTIEFGHIFALGKDKYSVTMNATYRDASDKAQPFWMGCYGIGVSRLLAVIYETSARRDANGNVIGISLPECVAPYKYQIIYTPARQTDAEKFYATHKAESILDDRTNVTFGAKIHDAKKLGTPNIVIFGDKTKGDKYELESI
ncbi:MAG: hypothetical protein LBG88_00110 [Christensenellaceae bacterium]|jgi:prolyl-tRNA synthetase|nr:hypothetical protein [Christensenellaceae bacterium]